MFSLFTALSIQKRPAVVLDTYYILAAAVLLICLIILVCCICKHRRKKKNNARRGSEQLIYKAPKPATEYRKVQPLKSELAAMVRNQLLYLLSRALLLLLLLCWSLPIFHEQLCSRRHHAHTAKALYILRVIFNFCRGFRGTLFKVYNIPYLNIVGWGVKMLSTSLNNT